MRRLKLKMTGTASNRGISVLDLDVHRNQEWLRRRKLRLEQVRKQSNEIAKAIRQKVISEDQARLDEYDRMREAKLKDWKAEKLNELERKLRCALEEFGKGYKLADDEPDPKELLEEKQELNWENAQKRGEAAKHEEHKRKKLAEGQKMALIQRKELIRKKEDLRSALIHSVPIKKQLIDTQRESEEKHHSEKVAFSPVKKKIICHKEQSISDSLKKVWVNKVRRKKVVPQKSCKCKHKTKSPEFCPKRSETLWINLNEVQNSSSGDLGLHVTSSKSTGSNQRSQKEKPEGFVEFYDFSSRYYRKSFGEFPHFVERIHSKSEMLNANDLAEIESEKEKIQAKKRVGADNVRQERGAEALRKEKINLEYNNLMAKLEELNRREKMLKAQQRHLPSFLHMNDERLSERLKAKQRMMDSRFEDIYYEAISQIPRAEAPRPKPLCRKGGGDFDEGDEKPPTLLDFSPAPRLKPNTPITFITSQNSQTSHTSPEGTTRKRKRTKKKGQLLVDIDKALKEGRELRKAISRNRDSVSLEEVEGKEKTSSDSEEVEVRIVSSSPRKDEGKTTKSQELQTAEPFLKEDLKTTEAGGAEVVSKTGDDSLPVSTSTSYKSPPSVIRSYRLRQLLEYLEGVSEVEDNGSMQNRPKFSKKMDEFVQELLHGDYTYNKSGKANEKPYLSPTLEYYIKKLLNMSRECIADLSVSSENVSIPTVTEPDTRELKPPEPILACETTPKGEDLIRKSRLDRAGLLDEAVKNWKWILEKNLEEASEVEDEPDFSHPEPARTKAVSENIPDEPPSVICSPKISSRYEEITKRCSDRILELSNMLDQVRKNKEKLLCSTSGGSSRSLSRDGENSEKEFEVNEEEEEAPVQKCVENPATPLAEGFFNRYNLSRPRKETVSTIAVADSQSLRDIEESLESWPDVMDELLKRKILTSPFNWSDGEYSSEVTALSDGQTKFSSIETVIGNFRKEISKIKPFTLSGSFSQSNSFPKSPRSCEEFFCGTRTPASRWNANENVKVFQDESSVESINQALTSLGLNWAKTFLKKNEESRAINSSSNSEGKCSGDEADNFL